MERREFIERVARGKQDKNVILVTLEILEIEYYICKTRDKLEIFAKDKEEFDMVINFLDINRYCWRFYNDIELCNKNYSDYTSIIVYI